MFPSVRDASYQIDPYPVDETTRREPPTSASEVPLLGRDSYHTPSSSTADEPAYPSNALTNTFPPHASRTGTASHSTTPPPQALTDRAVYVVHHDGGRAPVTVYTSDGAQVVELPPRYPADRQERRVVNVDSEAPGSPSGPGRQLRARSISKGARRVVS